MSLVRWLLALLVPLSAAATEAIPFEDNAGQPILRATVRGEPMTMLLDTGASPCVVDTEVAKRLGLGVHGTTARMGGGGVFRSGDISDAVDIDVGAIRIGCARSIATTLADVSGLIGRPIDGIIGGDFFRNRVVRIDYDRAVIEVSARAGYRYRGNGARVPIRIENNRPLVMMLLSIPGRERVPRELIVDTGSFDAVSDPLIGELDDLTDVTTSGLGAGTASRAGRFSRVEIGPFAFDDVRGVEPNVPIVGNAILARFNLVFDYDGGWMVLEKRLGEPTDERLRLRW